MNRFEQSAAKMQLPLPMPSNKILAQIYQLIKLNNLQDASMRLVLTGGYSEDAYTPSKRPNFLILVHPAPTVDPNTYNKGIKLITHEFQRSFPRVKTTNYLTGIMMLDTIKAAKAADLLFHREGIVSETTRANFFIVNAQNQILTSKDSILRGVTRKQVLALSKKYYDVVEGSLTLTGLSTAKEAFITSSTKGVMSVVLVDSIRIGDGEVGPIAKHLQQLFTAYQEAYLASKK